MNWNDLLAIRFIKNFFNSLKNDDKGYSQRKVVIAGFVTIVLGADIVYIVNCYQRNLFDSTFIAWMGTQLGFISATLIALYGSKAKPTADKVVE